MISVCLKKQSIVAHLRLVVVGSGSSVASPRWDALLASIESACVVGVRSVGCLLSHGCLALLSAGQKVGYRGCGRRGHLTIGRHTIKGRVVYLQIGVNRNGHLRCSSPRAGQLVFQHRPMIKETLGWMWITGSPG